MCESKARRCAYAFGKEWNARSCACARRVKKTGTETAADVVVVVAGVGAMLCRRRQPGGNTATGVPPGQSSTNASRRCSSSRRCPRYPPGHPTELQRLHARGATYPGATAPQCDHARRTECRGFVVARVWSSPCALAHTHTHTRIFMHIR